MDRKAWIAVVVCVAALGLWQWASMKYYTPTPAQVAEAQRVAEAEKAAASTPVPVATPTPAVLPVQTAAPVVPEPPEPAVPHEEFEISTKLADYRFVSGAGGIASAKLSGHLGENGSKVFVNIPEAPPIGALTDETGKLFGGFTRVASDPEAAVFLKSASDGLEVRKAFRVEEGTDDGNYTVKLKVEFSNRGTAPIDRPGFFVSTGGTAPIHYSDMPIYTGFDWYREGKATFIDVNWFNAGSIPLVGIQTRPARDLYDQKADKISWAAVKNQYFTTILSLESGDPATTLWARRLERVHPGEEEHKVLGIEGALGLPGFRLEPGQIKSWDFQIYTGPKELGRLAKLGRGEQAVMNFGIFKWVSEILLYSMNALYRVLGNFAAAIIVLTILIKAVLWPLQNKATSSMRKMAALSPKMTELREKYKDDPTRMNQELMRLYKDYGVNPFGGCFPMLIQIPIFFGFYSMLGTAIELRNASFLWVHDLSQPDTVGHLLGFPVNVLPLLMALTMVWQMSLTPKTGDATQQRMFMFMPMIFVLFAYNYASALSLYWTTQNLISIAQLYLTRNQPVPELQKVALTRKKALEAARVKKRK